MRAARTRVRCSRTVSIRDRPIGHMMGGICSTPRWTPERARISGCCRIHRIHRPVMILFRLRERRPWKAKASCHRMATGSPHVRRNGPGRGVVRPFHRRWPGMVSTAGGTSTLAARWKRAVSSRAQPYSSRVDGRSQRLGIIAARLWNAKAVVHFQLSHDNSRSQRISLRAVSRRAELPGPEIHELRSAGVGCAAELAEVADGKAMTRCR